MIKDLKALETSIADDFRASGLVDWRGLTSRAMEDARMQRRNERIYELKGSGHSDAEIAEAVGVGVRQVCRIIRDQLILRRANVAP